jgi:muconolactone delta-isomerase
MEFLVTMTTQVPAGTSDDVSCGCPPFWTHSLMSSWMTVQTTPLAVHPSDPAATSTS